MKEAIQANVIAYIASFANMPAEAIRDKYALRAYLKSLNDKETVLVTDLRKSGLDVQRTYELIISKAGL